LKLMDGVGTPPCVVFAGDSLTQEFPVSEAFGSACVANRGVGAETSLGLLERISALRYRPAAIFLMTGANDVQMLRLSPDQEFRSWCRIVTAIKFRSPATVVYVQGILPSSSPRYSAWAREVNALLRKIPGTTYVDLASLFTTPEGLINEKLTRDGLHLSAEGYQVWIAAVQPYVARHTKHALKLAAM
jgi:lysophospholipase L1-like esterase